MQDQLRSDTHEHNRLCNQTTQEILEQIASLSGQLKKTCPKCTHTLNQMEDLYIIYVAEVATVAAELRDHQKCCCHVRK